MNEEILVKLLSNLPKVTGLSKNLAVRFIYESLKEKNKNKLKTLCKLIEDFKVCKKCFGVSYNSSVCMHCEKSINADVLAVVQNSIVRDKIAKFFNFKFFVLETFLDEESEDYDFIKIKEKMLDLIKSVDEILFVIRDNFSLMVLIETLKENLLNKKVTVPRIIGNIKSYTSLDSEILRDCIEVRRQVNGL